jgi:MYXO-CTERM domain-containing protein
MGVMAVSVPVEARARVGDQAPRFKTLDENTKDPPVRYSYAAGADAGGASDSGGVKTDTLRPRPSDIGGNCSVSGRPAGLSYLMLLAVLGLLRAARRRRGGYVPRRHRPGVHRGL